MDGWIKIHRQLLSSNSWLAEPFNRSQAWIDLIGLSNFVESYFYIRGVKVTVGRGQLAWGDRKLSERWRWSKNKVNKFLKELVKEQQISVVQSNVVHMITILNYDLYQDNSATECTADDTASDTTKWPIIRTIKKDKNIIYSPMFEKFWEIYTRKGSKSIAYQQWTKIGIEKDDLMFAQMSNHVVAYVEATARIYLKDAERYLKTKLWEGK